MLQEPCRTESKQNHVLHGTVLGTKVQKGHKGAFFLGERHYTEGKLGLLSVNEFT